MCLWKKNETSKRNNKNIGSPAVTCSQSFISAHSHKIQSLKVNNQGLSTTINRKPITTMPIPTKQRSITTSQRMIGTTGMSEEQMNKKLDSMSWGDDLDEILAAEATPSVSHNHSRRSSTSSRSSTCSSRSGSNRSAPTSRRQSNEPKPKIYPKLGL